MCAAKAIEVFSESNGSFFQKGIYHGACYANSLELNQTPSKMTSQTPIRNLMAEELCDGALGPLAMALVEKNNFSEDELQSFRELIDKLDREGS